MPSRLPPPNPLPLRIADKAFYQQPDADIIGYVYVCLLCSSVWGSWRGRGPYVWLAQFLESPACGVQECGWARAGRGYDQSRGDPQSAQHLRHSSKCLWRSFLRGGDSAKTDREKKRMTGHARVGGASAKLPNSFPKRCLWGWEVGCRGLLLNEANIECVSWRHKKRARSTPIPFCYPQVHCSSLELLPKLVL